MDVVGTYFLSPTSRRLRVEQQLWPPLSSLSADSHDAFEEEILQYELSSSALFTSYELKKMTSSR